MTRKEREAEDQQQSSAQIPSYQRTNSGRRRMVDGEEKDLQLDASR